MTDSIQHSPLNAESLEVSLTVADLRKSVDWYVSTLGFDVDRQHERSGTLVAVSLKAGNVRILLGQDDGSKGADRVKGEGFSFQITTRQDIDALARRAVDAGATLDTPPVDLFPGKRVFRLRDPDGFRIAVSSDPNQPR